ncbi:beta-ketoacyl-[acyl-carrier-protein] synthase family protein [Streptomyces sp. NPDC057702]|uniref:beta-ketoacyl-[acyl-carrier-protein] synthase family protein n=1 Tax=unclassified Streptomyces TaxID=2593676 RepID=UPI003690BB17
MATDVVITGLGVVSPLGNHPREYWDRLLRGEVPVRPLAAPGTAVDGTHTYPVTDTPPAAPHPGGAPGRASTFALAAAADALRDAGLDGAGPEVLDGVGVCVGTGNGDSDLREAEREGRRELTGLQWYPYDTASLLAERLALHGPGLTVSTACAAGAYVVAMGAEMIRSGEAEVVLVGGTEAVSRPAVGAFLRLGAAEPGPCRPFDADRAGTVYGEGAAFLVLESATRARARGAEPYARVLDSGWSCDAFHETAPDPEGTQALRAVREALHRSGLDRQEVGAVLCHGTGTPANDAIESRTTATLLGPRTPEVPVTAIKASLGHSGGAAGAFACLTAALVLRDGLVPPVGTLRRLDPACDLRVVRDAPRASAGSAVLVNAYAFGGNNISVALAAPGPAATDPAAATTDTHGRAGGARPVPPREGAA